MFNILEEEISMRTGSAMFGPPGKEEDRNGPYAKPRTLGLGWLLYGFVRAARPKTILEIGCGGSTACLLWGLKHNGIGHLNICDVFLSGDSDDKHFINYLKDENGDPINYNKAEAIRMIKRWEMGDICTIHHESSKELLPKWNSKIDMLVVDGNHSKEFLENDVQFLNFLIPGGYGLFHDFLACLYEVGRTLRDWVRQSDEWSLIVEPNCLSMGIVQRKFSISSKHGWMATRLTKPDNPNAAKTPFQLTDPRTCGEIISWNGKWFPETPEECHSEIPEGDALAVKIMEYEAKTGKVLEDLDEIEI